MDCMILYGIQAVQDMYMLKIYNMQEVQITYISNSASSYN